MWAKATCPKQKTKNSTETALSPTDDPEEASLLLFLSVEQLRQSISHTKSKFPQI